MAKIKIEKKLVEGELVIFDKDGTLVDFCYTWEKIARARIRILAEKMRVSSFVTREISRSFGIDPDTGFIDPRGPLVQASQEDEAIIAASILYREGYPWDEARQIAEEVFQMAENRYPVEQLTRPAPGVKMVIPKLKRAGLKIAVATIDSYKRTLEVLEIIGLKNFFDLIISKDDVKNPKPHPEMILTICNRLNIPPEKALIVGDTVNDMIMGKRARVALTVGILNGVNTPETFSGLADVIIKSLSQIEVNSGG